MSQSKKWIYCDKCKTETWGKPVSGFFFSCYECNGDVDLRASKKFLTKQKKESRKTKAKEMGTYVSDSTKKERRRVNRNGERDHDFIQFIKSKPCLVCGRLGVDSHHTILKSQGGGDDSCVPLCNFHHLHTFHRECGSIEKFKETTGIDLSEENLKLLAEFRKHNVIT